MTEKQLPSGIIAVEFPSAERELTADANARAEWKKNHSHCPDCGCCDYEMTCVGFFGIKDTFNRATCCNCGWKGKVCDLVPEGRAARWIPVSERLPNRSRLCLVFAESSDPKSPLIVVTSYTPDMPRESTWGFLVEAWSKAVSHWMPLPRGPQCS